MLLVLFNIGNERFGLDARDLTEILPAVPLHPVLAAPRGVAGLLLHREALVPVIDLDVLTSGEPCVTRLSTRILVAHYRAGPEGARVGLRVDRANDTETVDPSEFEDSGLTAAKPPYFGPVLRRGLRTIQIVNVEQLLTDEVRASLFTRNRPA